jgi:hypothetical protein
MARIFNRAIGPYGIYYRTKKSTVCEMFYKANFMANPVAGSKNS